MTPAEKAAELCRARGGDFTAEVEAHFLTGVAISTPELFLMGRPMPRDGDPSDIWRAWPRAECDAWFVWVGVGDARALIRQMPFPLPWVGWYRQGREWSAERWLPTQLLWNKLRGF